ncbi:MAG: tRNA pseudouridine(38-40) synthase TruA [Acidimicrobiales bacterium]
MTLFDPDIAADPGAGAQSGSVVTPPARGPVPAVTTRLRLGVAYDGSGFRGFAAQPGQRTVGGELARAIAVVAGHTVELVCAGRTDAGVHATGQVVHVDVDPGTDPQRLLRSVNAMLGPAVVVRSAEVAAPGFDARRSATARRYRYLVLEAPGPDPLLAPLSWHVPGPLDVRAMRSGADALLGEHDFRAFCRRVPGTEPGTPIPRRVLDARFALVPVGPPDIEGGARLLRFDIEATSFCHQMVRSVVGVLVDVGRGRRRASDVSWLLRSGDRSGGGNVLAPPQGLCLTAVAYGE